MILFRNQGGASSVGARLDSPNGANASTGVQDHRYAGEGESSLAPTMTGDAAEYDISTMKELEGTAVYFQHSSDIWRDFPHLVPGVLYAEGITAAVSVDAQVAAFTAIASSRLANASEGELPEIQAWRRAFAQMGLKPTQYRCAAESLLRRFRKEGALPRIHPLIDLCNAISLAFAIPVAVFDVSRIAEYVQVCYATGDERYETFAREIEHPDTHEVIFADAAGRAHARRWSNRQSGYSAVRETTAAALIVAEALHASAATDVLKLVAAIADALASTWSATATTAILRPDAPRFTF